MLKQRLCNEVHAVSKFAYLHDRMSACGGCEAAVTARTRCVLVRFRECGELLYGQGSTNANWGCFARAMWSLQFCLKASHGAWKGDENFVRDREMRGESQG